jgi:hypothetical protein
MNDNTKYDRNLIEIFDHLKNHPQLLPFIGSQWNNSPHKVLLVAESHYLPEEYDNQFGLHEWNNLDLSNSSDDKRTGYTHTRNNAYHAWHPIHNTIFRSLKSICNYSHHQEAYDNLSYYNYFQRPAEVNGKEIRNSPEDNRIAFEFLQEIRNQIKPEWVIFLSKRSFHSYRKSGGKMDRLSCVPHPNSSWWNRKSTAHDNRTGKEKFEQILTKVFINKEL